MRDRVGLISSRDRTDRHYTDYRDAPDRVGGQVAGARFVCVSCHAAKADAPNLVGNCFRP